MSDSLTNNSPQWNNARSISIIRSPNTQSRCFVTFLYRRNRDPISTVSGSKLRSPSDSDLHFDLQPEVRFKQSVVDHGTQCQATLLWVDFHGRLVSYGLLSPGSTKTIDSFAGHVWLAYDSVHGDFFEMSVLSATPHFDGFSVGPQPRRIFPLPTPLASSRGSSAGDRLVVLIHLPKLTLQRICERSIRDLLLSAARESCPHDLSDSKRASLLSGKSAERSRAPHSPNDSAPEPIRSPSPSHLLDSSIQNTLTAAPSNTSNCASTETNSPCDTPSTDSAAPNCKSSSSSSSEAAAACDPTSTLSDSSITTPQSDSSATALSSSASTSRPPAAPNGFTFPSTIAQAESARERLLERQARAVAARSPPTPCPLCPLAHGEKVQRLRDFADECERERLGGGASASASHEQTPVNGRLPLHFAARVSSSAFSPDADKEKDTLADADALADSARGFALLTCSNPLCTICKRMHLMRLAAILPLPAHLLARIVADPRWPELNFETWHSDRDRELIHQFRTQLRAFLQLNPPIASLLAAQLFPNANPNANPAGVPQDQ